jgi:hypothetical protein
MQKVPEPALARKHPPEKIRRALSVRVVERMKEACARGDKFGDVIRYNCPLIVEHENVAGVP